MTAEVPKRRGVDEESWEARSSHWSVPKPSLRHNSPKPLVLTGHGMRLRINGGALEVQNGFTHYPQKPEKWRFFRGDANLPSRIIVLDGGGAVTLDVFGWLSEQNIPLIQVDFRGRVVAAIGSNCLGADPGLLHLQVAAAKCPTKSLTIAAWLIKEKLLASRAVLARVAPVSRAREVAIARLEAEIERLGQPWAGTKDALLGIEGKCAEVYFSAWRETALKWVGTGRRPIPDRWRVIGPRGSRRDRGNKGATHPFQAMLNYGYAVLESQLRIETARVGLDAATSFLHQQHPDRAALILDLVEPLRPVIDEKVIRFATRQTFSAADFTLSSEGTCRLHPQLSRRVVAEIDQVEGIQAVLAELMKRIGHNPPLALSHRSKAWLAQRASIAPASTH
jgi:CRISPR-associated protein Cas1